MYEGAGRCSASETLPFLPEALVNQRGVVLDLAADGQQVWTFGCILLVLHVSRKIFGSANLTDRVHAFSTGFRLEFGLYLDWTSLCESLIWDVSELYKIYPSGRDSRVRSGRGRWTKRRSQDKIRKEIYPYASFLAISRPVMFFLQEYVYMILAQRRSLQVSCIYPYFPIVYPCLDVLFHSTLSYLPFLSFAGDLKEWISSRGVFWFRFTESEIIFTIKRQFIFGTN